MNGAALFWFCFLGTLIICVLMLLCVVLVVIGLLFIVAGIVCVF